MIKIKIIRRQVCSGNIRSYIKKPEEFIKTFENIKEFGSFINGINNHKNLFIYDVNSLEILEIKGE